MKFFAGNICTFFWVLWKMAAVLHQVYFVEMVNEKRGDIDSQNGFVAERKGVVFVIAFLDFPV